MSVSVCVCVCYCAKVSTMLSGSFVSVANRLTSLLRVSVFSDLVCSTGSRLNYNARSREEKKNTRATSSST